MAVGQTRNGWHDDGKLISGSAKKCPNCGSVNYRETISVEECFSCGLKCDYWGGGTNEVYERYEAEYHRKNQEAEERSWHQNYCEDPNCSEFSCRERNAPDPEEDY